VSKAFAGQNFFISGAARGLGRALALGLAADGAIVGMADIDAAALESTAGEIAAAGGAAEAYVGDLSIRGEFERIGDTFAHQVGGLNAVINNASLLVYESIAEVSEATLDRMLGAGLKSAVWGSQLLIRQRKPNVQVSIINFSSPVAFKGYPNSSIYSAIKCATTGLTRTLAAELGPLGIRVNALAPGSVPTPGALKYVTAEEYQRRAATIPLRRLGHEEDVVAAARFLLSDSASFINGTVLCVDGGIIASA
jgi:meso-butanediol dehydrogenase / (S,S)-butanediol dehydrogenase / diacetyl reductase